MTSDSGTEALRAVFRARHSKFNIGNIARDAGCSINALEAFVTSGARLAPEILGALAKLLLDAAYDAETDKLRPLHPPEVRPLGIRPDPAKPGPPLPTFPRERNIALVKPPATAPSGAFPRRPGFAR